MTILRAKRLEGLLDYHILLGAANVIMGNSLS